MLKDVYSLSQLCEIYKDVKINNKKLQKNTLEKHLRAGGKGLILNVDFKQSGRTWILTKQGMEKYIKMKQKDIK